MFLPDPRLELVKLFCLFFLRVTLSEIKWRKRFLRGKYIQYN